MPTEHSQTIRTAFSWEEIRRDPDFAGRWVAIEGSEFDPDTGETIGGTVVDADDCLSTLCLRVKGADRRDCAILQCPARPMSRSIA